MSIAIKVTEKNKLLSEADNLSTFKVLEKIFLFSTMVSDLALELLFGAADMVVPHVDRQQLTAPTVQHMPVSM